MANKLDEMKALLADLSSERAQLDAAIEEMLRQTLARTKPENFHIPPRRMLPHRVRQPSQIAWETARMVRRRSLAILGKT
jgi:hypothetical protein